MDLFEMFECIKQMPILQLQETKGNFFGAVMTNTQLKSVQEILRTFFGEPLKPERVKVTPEVSDLSCDYGGIRENQTLYYRKDSSNAVLAMIWPWSDNERFTLKIIREY